MTGSGEVKAQPDMAYVTLGVEARKPTLADARSEVNAAVERILALTRELKIEPKFVDSTRLQVQPDYRWDEKASKQVLLGYVVSRQIEVEVRDLDRLGTLLEKSVSAGVNQVGEARLDSSRRKELEREALTQSRRRRPPECGHPGPRGGCKARPGTEHQHHGDDAGTDVCAEGRCPSRRHRRWRMRRMRATCRPR